MFARISAHNGLRHAKRALIVTVIVTSASLSGPVLPASAQPAAANADVVDLVSLTPIDPRSGTSIETVRFRAIVHYALASADHGLLLLFAFENDDATAMQQTELGTPVDAGDGTYQIDFDYDPAPVVQHVSFLAALLQDDQNMLAWQATDTLDVPQWQAHSAFMRAMDARRDNDFASALDDLNFALQAAPDVGTLLYWRGDTYIHLQQFELATADFTSALDLMPGDQASLVGRGVARVWQQDWQEAIDDLSAALSNPDPSADWMAPAYRARGLAYAGLGQAQAAIADYQQYLQLRPDAADRDQVAGWITSLGSP